MENLEIFDKSGKSLHIADVIYSFIKNVAEENNKAIEDVLVGVDVGFPEGNAPVWIYTTEPVNNGYDAIDLNDFGKPIKVNCIKTKVQMENKSSKPAQKQALRKTNVMRWLDYPEHQPNIGDEVVICYPSNKELGLLKRELVEWTFKTMNNSANNPNLKFKWLRLPPVIP